MFNDDKLSNAELASLKEIAKGVHQHPVSTEHAQRLLDLKLAYRILGDLRITAKGRSVVIVNSRGVRL